MEKVTGRLLKTLPFLTATLLISLSLTANAESSSMTSKNNEKIVTEFIAAWSNLDAEELVSYFSADGIYHNMPTQAVSGHENLLRFISGFISNWDKTDWEIIAIAAKDDFVMVERLDKTVVNGKPVNLPCFGIFILENGKIKEWRDYFDMNTYTSALSK